MTSLQAPEESMLPDGRQRKDEAEMVYMHFFDKTLQPFEFHDRFKLDRYTRYIIPSGWQEQMQRAVRTGFDYDMLQRYLAYHRRAIHVLDCEIAQHPAICATHMRAATQQAGRYLAFRTGIADLQTCYKKLDSHRRIVCMLNCDKQVMLNDIRRVSLIHNPHSFYD